MLEFNPIQELQNRLAKNPLKETDDLTEFIQNASRLAALGDKTKIEELPTLFAKEPFTGKIVDILKQRCEEGWWDVSEYTGKYLALSLIDAQDFYCFWQRNEDKFPELKPYFTKWFQDAEDVEIDDECAEFLEAFLETFPIPEEERLPVVDTPITEREFELLEFAYRNVKLPVVELLMQPMLHTQPQHQIQLYDVKTVKYTTRPTMLHAASDDTNMPSEVLKSMMQTSGTAKINDKEVFVETQLDDSWKLNLEIECDIPVERIRLGMIPAFQNFEIDNRWNVELKMFADKIRREFLEQPLFIQLSNGYCIKCFLPFP